MEGLNTDISGMVWLISRTDMRMSACTEISLKLSPDSSLASFKTRPAVSGSSAEHETAPATISPAENYVKEKKKSGSTAFPLFAIER